MKKALFLILGISAILASVCFTGCSTSPKGTEGQILLSDTLVSGTKGMVTVTLKDADLTGASEAVKVTSSADPVGITLNLIGKNGVYTGTLAFSTIVSGSDTIQVSNNSLVTFTYKDALPAGTRTETLVWKGGAIGVSVDKAAYVGLSAAMVITVTDTNVSSSTVTANITTTSFPTAMPVTCKMVPGSYGVYVATVYFTVSSAITTIDTVHVKDQDSVTVSYGDLVVPALQATAKAQWQGAAVSISTDSSAYNGFENMNITLTDDHVAVASLVVLVSSANVGDTVPVTLTSSQSNPSTFSGSIGFSAAKSASSIGVKDSDMVTVSFYDTIKNQAKSATVNWYSTMKPGLGIFSAEVTPASTVDTSVMPTLFNWATTCTFDQTDSMGVNGKTPALSVVAGTVGWAGFGWCNTVAGAASGIDMSAYAACTLHVSIKGNATGVNLLVENNNPTANAAMQTWVPAGNDTTVTPGVTDYGYRPDGAWHNIAVPLSAWSATCDLTQLTYFLGVTFSPYVAGQYMVVDNLYWTLPAATASTAKKLAKKLSK